jgi:FKBP-type peptidyl-prolyl cis-trans isomerase FklB
MPGIAGFHLKERQISGTLSAHRMNTKYLAMTLAACCTAGLLQAQDTKAPMDKEGKISYSMGYNVGNSWKRSGFKTNEVDLNLFLSGLRDSMMGREPVVSERENRELLTAFAAELRTRREAMRKELEAKNQKETAAFLAENKAKPGVHVLPDGLQYKIITEGNGPKPASNEMVVVNYKGTLLDGTEFDSSYKRGQPSTFVVSRVIKGWSQALQMMPVGSKWELFIPPDLAYGSRGTPTIGPDATLVFEVDLLSIKAPPKAAAVKNSQQQPVTSDIIKVPSAADIKKGAKVEIIKPDQIQKEIEKEKKENAAK